MTKLPGWATTVLRKRAAIEDIIGMQIGKPYACGHWGCVFEGEGVWSVKLTRDPTEGPMWARLQAWIAEANYGTDGMARVQQLVRLKPDIRWRKKDYPLHVIVREEIEPLMQSNSYWFSDWTQQRLGFEPGHLLGTYGTPSDMTPLQSSNLLELKRLLRGLEKYREGATVWNHQESLKRPDHRKKDTAYEVMIDATHLMSGPIGGYIGETLTSLMDDDVYLQDVHWNNIGWRVHSEIGDEVELPETLIIFDPGHTPTEARDVREELLANSG